MCTYINRYTKCGSFEDCKKMSHIDLKKVLIAKAPFMT